MKISCQTCNTDYVDSSPAAVAEPRSCPWCSHTTAAPILEIFTKESLEAAWKATRALGPVPRIDFYDAPELGPGAVAVLLDGEPAGWMSGEKFAELKRRLAEEGKR